ncbi:25563_t:CDS:2 [Gigaspora rosea]|nr:25563_t:CDS:2 [Gigaspora rosea]
MSACIYSIKDQMYLKFEDYYSLKEQVEHGLSGNIKNEFLNAKEYEIKLSDQKHIVLMPYNDGHRHAGHREVKILKHHDYKKEIVESNFIVKGDKDNKDNYFLLVRGEKNDGDTKNLTGYMFESNNIMIHHNGTIFIYKRDTHIILARNIVTLEFIAYLPTEWEIDCTHPYIFNGEYNEERSEYPYIFINKETEKISEHPNIFTDEETEETFKLKLHQPCIINYNTIFYIYENELKLQNFPKVWKDKLNDIRSNCVAEEVLKEIDESTKSISHQHYDKWNISENDQNNILLSYNNVDKISINIPYTEINRIKRLKNNDLLIIVVRNEHENGPSEKNIYIWTIKENFKEMQKIRLNYFWSNPKSFKEEESFKEEYKGYLPYLFPPKFEFELKGENMQDFNKLMIEDYINSRSKLSLYGKYLMKHLLEKNNSESIEKLLKNIINFTMKNNDGNFISNIPLMKIITYNLRTLSQYPDTINWFLSRIVFFVPDNTLSEIINLNSTSYHLQKFGEYPNISDIDLISLKIEIFLNPVFKLRMLFLKLARKRIAKMRETHLDELRKVVRQIQNNTWPGLYKPYISPVLLDAIQMKSEPDEDD